MLLDLCNEPSTDVAEGAPERVHALEHLIELLVHLVRLRVDLSGLLIAFDGLLSQDWLDHRCRADTLAMLVQTEVAVLVILHRLLPLDGTLVLVLSLGRSAVLHRELAIVADDS